MSKQSSTRIVTGKVRFSYANVFQPRASIDGAEPKYSVSILIPKKDLVTVKNIQNAIEAVKNAGKEKWGGKIPVNLKTPLRDGDEERPDNQEYRGHYFINASSKQRPEIVDAALQKIIDPTEFYSGCYGRASINFFAYSANGNKGISAGLNNLQKISDGDSLGGRSRAEDDFSAFSTDDDDLLG